MRIEFGADVVSQAIGRALCDVHVEVSRMVVSHNPPAPASRREEAIRAVAALIYDVCELDGPVDLPQDAGAVVVEAGESSDD